MKVSNYIDVFFKVSNYIDVFLEVSNYIGVFAIEPPTELNLIPHVLARRLCQKYVNFQATNALPVKPKNRGQTGTALIPKYRHIFDNVFASRHVELEMKFSTVEWSKVY